MNEKRDIPAYMRTAIYIHLTFDQDDSHPSYVRFPRGLRVNMG
jgi:hypothetical protein